MANVLMYINTCFGGKANPLLLEQYGEKTACRLYKVKFFNNISSSAQIKKAVKNRTGMLLVCVTDIEIDSMNCKRLKTAIARNKIAGTVYS